MRIALATEGSRGDVYPMLALGDVLRAAGHDVRLLAPPDFEGVARERGFEYHAVGVHVRDYLTRNARSITRGSVALLGEITRYMRESLAAQFALLPELTRDADLVIAAGVQGGASTAAELNGVPYRYVVYCPGMFPSADHAPMMLPFQSMPRWANRLAWRLLWPPFVAGLGRMVNRERRKLGLAPGRDTLRLLIGERPVLAVDPGLAPCPADAPFAVQQIPCLHPHRPDEPLPEKLEAFLAAGEPPVYLGFGSMTDDAPGATTRELVGAVESLGCRAVISQGWAGLGDGPLPSHVFATGPVDHAALFPRCAAVVHHGGAGTTTTAARAGVPQVIVPHLLDQYYWARRIRDLGLGGPPVHRKRLNGRTLAAALEPILGNEFVAHRAHELGARLRAEADVEAGVAEMLAGI